MEDKILQDIKETVDEIEITVHDLEKRITPMESSIADYSCQKEHIRNMLYWWKGNGSPGARDYILKLVSEDRLMEIIKSTVQVVMEEERRKNKDNNFRWIDVLLGVGMLVLVGLQLL
jgi:DNA-binding response OmpR family regulator